LVLQNCGDLYFCQVKGNLRLRLRTVIMCRYSAPTGGGCTLRLKSIIKCNNNNTAKGVLRDVTHSLHTGVLCFQNVSQFHGTRVNVILFANIREVQQHGTDINSAMCRSAVPNFVRIERKYRKCGQNFIYALK
jgi:hypothetical protein